MNFVAKSTLSISVAVVAFASAVIIGDNGEVLTRHTSHKTNAQLLRGSSPLSG